jgi:hypothetical protein
MLPVARQSDLHVEDVGDDLVVYDHRTQAAHALNAAAVYVWEQCDGTRSPAEIADAARAAGLPWTEATIADAISQLQAKSLLGTAAADARPRMTRRGLTKAAVAALVPAIVSIASPAAALALSSPQFPPGDGPRVG